MGRSGPETRVQEKGKASGNLDPKGLSVGGDDRIRTGDLRLARAALSQLSYIPG